MSKERAASLKTVGDAIKRSSSAEEHASIDAGLVLVSDGLRSLDRIATALERLADVAQRIHPDKS